MTLTPPENVDYSRVEWQAISDIKDGPDLGNLPDFIAPTGSATFTASVVTLRNPTAAPNPVSILRDPITGVLDSEGYLCTSDENGEPAYRGVELIATDDPDLNPVDWVYNVTYNVRGHNGRQIPLKAHQIYAPAGVTVDLSVVGPVDNVTAIGIPAAEALAAQAAAAAADASVAASQALVAAEAAEAALVDSDAFVGSKIAEDGSATQTALNAQIGESAFTDAAARMRAAFAGRNVRPVVIVCAGDSITAGSAATAAARRWVNRLADATQRAYPLFDGTQQPATRLLTSAVTTPPSEPGIQFINAGVGGTTAANYLTATTGPQVSALGPDVIIHAVGTNDNNNGVTLSTYIANLTVRLDQLDADATRPVLHVLVHQQRRRTYVSSATWRAWGVALRELALARPAGTALYVDLVPAFEAVGVPGTDPYDLIDTDEVHPTDAGHEYLYEQMRRQLGITGVGSTTETVAPSPDPVETLTLITSDTFNRADTPVNALGSTDAGLGGTSGYAWSPSSQVQIISQEAGAVSLSAIRATTVDTSFNDHAAEITFKTLVQAGAVVRAQSNVSNADRYAVRATGTPLETITLMKYVGGTGTGLANFTSPMAVGDRLALRARGNVLTVYKNDEKIIEHTDTTYPTGTRCGFQSGSSDPAFRVDDFKAYRVEMVTP